MVAMLPDGGVLQNLRSAGAQRKVDKAFEDVYQAALAECRKRGLTP
jgi:hypothetical protein